MVVIGILNSAGAGTAKGLTPAWTPEGLPGLLYWHDPHDLSTMWEDTDGTVPADVDSPIARIDDKSGNGFHLLQATASRQPILRLVSDKYKLVADGIDDMMETAGFVNGLKHVVLGAAARQVPFANYQSLINKHYNNSYARIAVGGIDTADFLSTAHAWSGVYRLGGVEYPIATRPAPQGAARVVSQTFEEDVFGGGNTSWTDERLIMFEGNIAPASTDPWFPWDGDFFGGIGLNRLLTAGELANAETYFAYKSGGTL